MTRALAYGITHVFSVLSDHTQGDGASVFAPEMTAQGDANGALVNIMRHFSPALFIEVLRSICRQAIARAGDATGFQLHKASGSFVSQSRGVPPIKIITYLVYGT